MVAPEIDLTVYPDECDAFGHLNQASFLSLFERARWELLARGPGMDVFTREGVWPAVRKTVIDYHVAAFPGDVLRFQQILTHHGRTSFTMRQTARRVRDDTLIATAEFVFVCITRDGRPAAVPREVGLYLSAKPDPGEGAQQFVVNGVSLAVDISSTDGPPVLLIHGFPFDHRVWRHQLSHLIGFRLIAPDLRGMGHSDAPDLGYSIATYADDLMALLDLLGIDDVVICGLSLGGYVAFEIARRWPSRLRGLILMDTRAEADSPDARRSREALIADIRDRGPVAAADVMLPALFPGPGSPESDAAAEIRRTILATTASGLVGALSAMRDRQDSGDLLASLGRIPVCVMVGERDQLTPPDMAESMAARIPHAELVIIDGAGHLPPLEQPVETTRAMARFLGQIS